MCEPTSHQSGQAFDEGMTAIRTGRRTLLQAGAAGLAFSTAVSASPALAASESARAARASKKRAYVLVVDGD